MEFRTGRSSAYTVDKHPFLWYHSFQRLLLLYYLLDCAKGAAGRKPCSFFYGFCLVMDGYKSLNEGQAVEFEGKKGPKGLQAESVTGL